LDVKTLHRKYAGSAADMSCLADASIDLVVTSPPYPMIEMWDESFIRQDPRIASALENHDGHTAFERMHGVLDAVWSEVCRVLKPGRFACINIGDAVRKTGDEFGLFPNHARIVSAMVKHGLTPLPGILWRKQTNAPNKFMGSGMLPAGAYVTLEHEHILIFRKGGKRRFETAAERQARRESAIFWEERNAWYSDIWLDLKGTRQQVSNGRVRMRSGAFPFDLPHRLVNMYSIYGDTVLDPFMGTGTTILAAMACGRSSEGYEIEADLDAVTLAGPDEIIDFSKNLIHDRVGRHLSFVENRKASGKEIKHTNFHYGFPVMTSQEKEIRFNPLAALYQVGENTFTAVYDMLPAQMANMGLYCNPKPTT
jgi:modification methylase